MKKKIINESHLRRKEKIKNDEELVDRIDRIDRLYILRHYIYIYIYKWWKDVKNFPPKKKTIFKKEIIMKEASFFQYIYNKKTMKKTIGWKTIF